MTEQKEDFAQVLLAFLRTAEQASSDATAAAKKAEIALKRAKKSAKEALRAKIKIENLAQEISQLTGASDEDNLYKADIQAIIAKVEKKKRAQKKVKKLKHEQ